MKTVRVKQVADRLGKHPATIWRWVARGCDIDDENSIQQFLLGKRRQNPTSAECAVDPQESQHEPEPQSDLNSIELAPVGKRGAAAALQRLEEIEERAHARLMRAIEAGNQFQIKSAQEFFLRASESLRKLDAAVEIERRKADEQVPKFLVEQIATLISAWLRIAFAQFLSAESPGLMGIKDLGEFKFSAIARFRGILHATVKASLRANPPIPPWATAKVIKAWNVPGF